MDINDNSNIDIETDDRPPSFLQQLIKDPEEDVPFSDVPSLPESFGGWKLKDWVKMINAFYSVDRLRFCILMYTFSNDGSFSMDMVPKSFKKKDLPEKDLEEDEWINSFQYVAKTMDLENQYFYKEKIKSAADKLTEVDEEGRGPFLKKLDLEEGNTKYAFLSDLIFDAANQAYCGRRQYRALALAKPVFLYRYCMTSSQSMQKDYDNRDATISVHNNDEDIVFQIFIDQISKGHVNDTVANTMFEDQSFCRSFFQYMQRQKEKLKKGDKEKKIYTAIDVQSKPKKPKSLLYCLVVQNPPRNFMLDPVLEKMKIYCKEDFLDNQYKITIEYCCRKALMEIYLKLAPNVGSFPFSFIRSAIVGGDSVLLDRVLSHQSWNQNQLDKAMQWIAMSGKFDDYLRIKQAGAHPDSITLYESVMGRNISILEDVLRDGVDCDSDVYQGRKVIHAAAAMGNIDIIDMLIQRGADIESRSQRGELPLHIAIDNSHEDLAEHLLMRGADACQRDYRGATALIRACAKGLYRLVERLMYIGADMSNVDTQGCNILLKAYLSGEKEVIEFAKSKGFTIESVDKNENCVLHFSALSGNLNQFEQLLDQMPSKISACNSFMWNPASCAAISGRWNIFQFLKRNGANIEQVSANGKSILELATEWKQLRMSSKFGYIEEFHEFVSLGSLEEYENIIQSFKK